MSKDKNTEDFEYNEEYDQNLLDHDYDGIKELDNPVPGWSAAIFYITIAFSIIYAIYYFAMDGKTQYQEYDDACAEHEQKYKAKNESSAKLILLADEASLAEGQVIYTKMNCAICHGATGAGTANGPNLTDDAWLNGCSFDEVFSIIKNGKGGMTAFKGQMGDAKIQKVASYILQKLKGTTPENPKEAEGTPCK